VFQREIGRLPPPLHNWGSRARFATTCWDRVGVLEWGRIGVSQSVNSPVNQSIDQCPSPRSKGQGVAGSPPPTTTIFRRARATQINQSSSSRPTWRARACALQSPKKRSNGAASRLASIEPGPQPGPWGWGVRGKRRKNELQRRRGDAAAWVCQLQACCWPTVSGGSCGPVPSSSDPANSQGAWRLIPGRKCPAK